MKQPKFDGHINASVFTMPGGAGKPASPKSVKPSMKKLRKVGMTKQKSMC